MGTTVVIERHSLSGVKKATFFSCSLFSVQYFCCTKLSSTGKSWIEQQQRQQIANKPKTNLYTFFVSFPPEMTIFPFQAMHPNSAHLVGFSESESFRESSESFRTFFFDFGK